MTTAMLDVMGGASSSGSAATDLLTGLAGAGGIKAPCAVATTANVALLGLAAIDGYTPSAGDRILVWQQTSASQNGIYNASAGAWTRSVDCDGKSDLMKGTQVAVVNGATYGGQVFMVSAADPITVGVTALTFTASSFSPTTYVKKDGSTDITGAQGVRAGIVQKTAGGLTRWLLGRVTTETGSSNTGSDLELDAYADDGTTVLGYVWKAIRSSRVVDFFALPTIGGNTLVSQLPTFGASGGSHATGLVPDPGSSAGTSRYLREDATWVGLAIPEGGYRTLKILTTSATALTVSADMLTVWDTSFNALISRSVSKSLSTASSGAGGLDTGAIAASTWYAVWVIGKTDGTLAAMLSLSATAPTMPTGYTLKARYGWVRTDANASPRLYQQVQYGRRAQVIVDGTILTGPRQVIGVGPQALANVSLANFVPSTACVARFTMPVNNGAVSIAPSTAYGLESNAYFENRSSLPMVIPCDVVLETAQQIAVGSASVGGSVYLLGWEDNF